MSAATQKARHALRDEPSVSVLPPHYPSSSVTANMLGVLLCFAAVAQSQVHGSTHVLYVATNGNNIWSGGLPRPNDEHTDGPLATLSGARDAIRALRRDPGLRGPVRVEVLPGNYLSGGWKSKTFAAATDPYSDGFDSGYDAIRAGDSYRIVQPGSATFRAGRHARLTPGFPVGTGAQFRATAGRE